MIAVVLVMILLVMFLVLIAITFLLVVNVFLYSGVLEHQYFQVLLILFKMIENMSFITMMMMFKHWIWLSSKICKYDYDNALSSTSGCIQTLESNVQEVISRMFDVLGYRSFRRHHIQAFDQVPSVQGHFDGEWQFLANANIVPHSYIQCDGNIFDSHTV